MIAQHNKRQRKVGRPPKSRRLEQSTRNDILVAARHVFARYGVDGTSIREIADAANVNTAMIYYHFKDKADLYRAVLASSFAELEKIWNNAVFQSPASAREKMRKYINEFIRFENSNEELRKLFLSDFSGSSKNVRWIAQQFFESSHARLVRILKDGMKSGELKKRDPSFVIMTMIGMIAHSFMFKPLAEYVTGKSLNLSPKSFGAFVEAMLFDGLAANARCTGRGKAGLRRAS